MEHPIKCCSCSAVLAFEDPPVDRQELIEAAESLDWIWNGEEWWCGDCLGAVAESVP